MTPCLPMTAQTTGLDNGDFHLRGQPETSILRRTQRNTEPCILMLRMKKQTHTGAAIFPRVTEPIKGVDQNQALLTTSPVFFPLTRQGGLRSLFEAV